MKRQLSKTHLWLTLGVLLIAGALAPVGFTQQQATTAQATQPAASAATLIATC